jgi:hypothetical protein
MALPDDLFNEKWIDMVCRQTGLQITIDPDGWRIDQDSMPDTVDISFLHPVDFSLPPSPNKRKLHRPDNGDLPPSTVSKNIASPNFGIQGSKSVQPIGSLETRMEALADAETDSQEDGNSCSQVQDPVDDTVSDPQSQFLVYNHMKGKKLLHGVFPRAPCSLSDSVITINGTQEDLIARWQSFHLLTYPVTVLGVAQFSLMVVPTGELGSFLTSIIPQSSLQSFATVDLLYDHIVGECEVLKVLASNYSPTVES